jgi:hypothetical protein
MGVQSLKSYLTYLFRAQCYETFYIRYLLMLLIR